MPEEKTLIEKVDELTKVMEDRKEKKFRLPLSVILRQGKIRKKNYVIVFFIRTNDITRFIFWIKSNIIRNKIRPIRICTFP